MSRAVALLAVLLPACAAAAPWDFVADQSRLEFTAYYEDEPFDGRFETFSVEVDFDPANPAAACLDVRVDPTSVDTDNRDRDEALAEPEWFDFANIGESRYLASGFEETSGGGYRAAGELTLKGVTRSVPIEFEWLPVGTGGAVLTGVVRMVGEADVNRLDFDIGTGEWADPLIGHRVDLRFHVVVQRP